jgi:uncharacterized protein
MADTQVGQPVQASERILALDVLRGFAMFGVLLAYCMWSLGTAPDESWTKLDQRLGTFVNFAVDGKFYTILAFLFGLGFSIQLSRAASDASAVETYCRRLACLAGIGLIHALLLRNGDILLPYALTGFLLIPFRHRSDRTILITAFIVLLIPTAVGLPWDLSGLPFPERPHLESAPYLIENAAWVHYWYATAFLTWPLNLTLFLFGLLAGRHGLIVRLAQQPKVLVRIALSGLVAATALFFAAPAVAGLARPASGYLGQLLFDVHCWCLSSAYVATLLLVLTTAPGRAALTPLAAIGRLALTNYLSQAAIIVPLCLAFGWFDQFRPTTSILLTLAAFFLVQLPFSLAWGSRFQFGPAEWFWRLLTYGKMPPLKRAIATALPQ